MIHCLGLFFLTRFRKILYAFDRRELYWASGVHFTPTDTAPMTVEKMPLMLDNTVPVDLNDVDDLFGDGVGLSLPDRSHNKPLSLKVDDLRNRGCCQCVHEDSLPDNCVYG